MYYGFENVTRKGGGGKTTRKKNRCLLTSRKQQSEESEEEDLEQILREQLGNNIPVSPLVHPGFPGWFYFLLLLKSTR
jgi:hypothetical protein